MDDFTEWMSMFMEIWFFTSGSISPETNSHILPAIVDAGKCSYCNN